MCAYQFIYTKKINQLTVHQNLFYGVRNLVLYLKCYNLPFFGWRYGNVDNYSLFGFFLHVILCILSQCVQNYRPTHEQTNILLDQLQNTFFSHITCSGGGGTIIEIICLL